MQVWAKAFPKVTASVNLYYVNAIYLHVLVYNCISLDTNNHGLKTVSTSATVWAAVFLSYVSQRIGNVYPLYAISTSG